MSTSPPLAAAAVSVGEDLFDLSDLMADLSPEGEEPDDSFGFLSVFLVLPVADDDVELESVFVLVLSDFVLSLDLASSVVVVCYLMVVVLM